MRPTTKLLSAIVIGSIIALVLSFLPGISSERVKEHAPRRMDSQAVISLAYGSRLSDENLVDYMASMPLTLGIRRIDWREPWLYIDLYVKYHDMRRDQIFADIKEVSLFSLQAMKNVRNVFVRVYDARHNEASLMLAVSADVHQMKQEVPNDPSDAEVDSERYVLERFRVQQTSHWMEWIDGQN